MSSARQNRHIARLIVGGMSIDGSLSPAEREKVAATLEKIGMPELIADVGIAIEDDDGAFDLFQECKELLHCVGNDAREVAPLIFKIVCDVIASDRFVSSQESSYLSAMARRLGLSDELARSIFSNAIKTRKSRLEISGRDVDEQIHPHLKSMLSFEGADELVGQIPSGSIDDMLARARETNVIPHVSVDELNKALTVLGLPSSAKLEDATTVWKETINNLNLSKMADMGETFVSAAINRITRVNDAYKVILGFERQLTTR